jgi:hypothetical protein
VSTSEKVEPTPRIALFSALAVALLALALYRMTLHPGVGPSLDSMELQIASLVGGVIHPPGSPQYLMLGRLAMTILPGPNLAYRLNLMSAIAAALTVGVVCLTTYRLTHNLTASIFASLVLAVSTRFWYQASVAELYTLNALYVALVLYLLLAWHQTRKPVLFWVATVVYALSFGNHVSMILLLPVYFYVVEITERSMLLNPRNILFIGLIVIAAAAQYLYIPFRVATNPPFCNFCPSVEALPSYLTGGAFKSQMFSLARRDVLARLPESIGQWNRQFMPWGYILMIIGGWELIRKRSNLAWILVLGLAAEYVFVMMYDIPDWHDFLTPCYVISAPLIGYGGLMIWEIAEPHVRHLMLQGQTLAANTFAGVLVTLAAVALLISLYTNFPLVDQSDDTAFGANGHALLAQVEPGAWLLMPRPNSHTFLYSWALRYISYLDNPTTDLVIITPPEIEPPPGPAPYYDSWADVEPYLESKDTQLIVLDTADDRFAGWGFLPICDQGGRAVGYEVVAMTEVGQITPRGDQARWEAIQDYVIFDPAAEVVCPP